jgi:uncharacterized protein (TIGR03085 family)
MGVAKDERLALCALFEEVGPDAPTLCEGWQTRDLAAHLIVRERRVDAAPGIMLPALAPYTERVQRAYATRSWGEVVDLVRSGPPWFWSASVDAFANTAEFLVHHEDVRRARPDWSPRAADPVRDATAWKAVCRSSRLNFRKTPVGVVLRTPDGREAAAKRGPETVTVVGEPMDLLLYGFGRDAVEVSYKGADAAVAALKGVKRSA